MLVFVLLVCARVKILFVNIMLWRFGSHQRS